MSILPGRPLLPFKCEQRKVWQKKEWKVRELEKVGVPWKGVVGEDEESREPPRCLQVASLEM